MRIVKPDVSQKVAESPRRGGGSERQILVEEERFLPQRSQPQSRGASAATTANTA